MKNYQQLYYQNYYAQNKTGEYISVSRRECFAPPEEPSPENQYKQRWFYDPEAGYAVRLERGVLGEATHRANGASLKREERHRDRKTQCVWKGTEKCDQNCDHCSHKMNRTFELDKPMIGKDGDEGSGLNLADETASIEGILENKELLDALFSLLERLTHEERELWGFLQTKAKKQDIANYLRLTLDGVRYREQCLFSKIRADKTLRNFFEDH